MVAVVAFPLRVDVVEVMAVRMVHFFFLHKVGIGWLSKMAHSGGGGANVLVVCMSSLIQTDGLLGSLSSPPGEERDNQAMQWKLQSQGKIISFEPRLWIEKTCGKVTGLDGIGGNCELVRAEVNDGLTMQGLVKASLYSLLIWSRTALLHGNISYCGNWICNWSLYLSGGGTIVLKFWFTKKNVLLLFIWAFFVLFRKTIPSSLVGNRASPDSCKNYPFNHVKNN